MWFEDFPDGGCGGHLRYLTGMILAILNLYASHQVRLKVCGGISMSLRCLRSSSGSIQHTAGFQETFGEKVGASNICPNHMHIFRPCRKCMQSFKKTGHKPKGDTHSTYTLLRQK